MPPGKGDLDAARAKISTAIQQNGALAGALCRLALHDSLTYDENTRTGGCNGSIRTPEELEHRGNEGLQAAVDTIERVRQQLPIFSHADLIQLAGAMGIEATGGPRVPFLPGRKDSKVYPPEGRLPLYDKNQETPDQFWQCFKRTGLSHRDALALLGSHPFAAAWQDPAGAEARHGERPLQFTNAFYKQLLADSAPHWQRGLLRDPEMYRLARMYRDNLDLYTEDYAAALQRVAELGMPLPSASPARGASQETLTTAQVTAAVVVVGAAVAVSWWFSRRRRGARPY